MRSVTVPSVTQSVSVARRFVSAELADAGVEDDLVDTAVLLVSEIVTNAVLHAQTDVSINLHAGRGVLVEVVDHSTHLPRRRGHHEESVTGRGLELVEMLADGYGVHTLPGTGKAVWFTLGGAPAPAPGGWVLPPEAPPDDAEVAAVLSGLPVGLYEVLLEHNEALLREYDLYSLSGDGGLPAGQVAAAARARQRIIAGFREAVSAAPDGATHVDVTLCISPTDAGDFSHLPAVFAAAEELAQAGRLLTRPALPELRALRAWVFGDVVRQLAGEPATLWTTPEPDDVVVATSWPDDMDWVRTTDLAVVVGDGSNRIIAGSPGAGRLLGWPVEDLVGRRITALIPQRMHEVHITGFTRHLMTGRETILGHDISVAARHRRGHDVPVILRLEQVTASDGDLRFVAYLRPRPA